MIIRADTSVSFVISFPSGPPDGNVVWTLYGPDAISMATGTIVVPSGAVSVNVVVPAIRNGLTFGTLSSFRDLEWTYTVGGAVVNGEERYIIEARIPFGVSPAGVRLKLGIDDPVDLPDSDISLVRAYNSFQSTVTEPVLSAADPSALYVRDAIEAMAALALIPSLMVRLAKKEDSGTSSFQRQDIDWDALAGSLEPLVMEGILGLLPDYDPTLGAGALFLIVQQTTDPVTGNPYG